MRTKKFIKITGCSSPTSWYADKIGEVREYRGKEPFQYDSLNSYERYVLTATSSVDFFVKASDCVECDEKGNLIEPLFYFIDKPTAGISKYCICDIENCAASERTFDMKFSELATNKELLDAVFILYRIMLISRKL